jgi:Ca2+-binding EF-hand superfamily protein
MGIYMTGSEFRKLWRLFDASGDGKINYTEFNNKVGYMILPFGAGLKLNRPDTPQMKEWQEKALAKGIQKKISNIDTAFKEIDTDGSGRISHAEFIQALRKIGLANVGDAESFQMMSRFKKPTNNTGEMTLEEFRECMQSYMKIPTSIDSDHAPETKSGALKVAEAAVEATLPKDVERICSLFRPFDPNGNFEVSYEDFRLGLEAGGVKLTNPQFLSLVYKLDAIDDGIVGYRDFARQVCGGDAPVAPTGALDGLKHWIALGIRTAINNLTGRPMSRDDAVKRASSKTGLSEMEIRLAHSLLGRRQDLKAAFIRYDTSKRGEMSHSDVVHMLEALDVPVNKDLMETLFQKYDQNRNGELDYPEFEKWMGPLMEVSDGNLKRLGLERMSAEELAEARKGQGGGGATGAVRRASASGPSGARRASGSGPSGRRASGSGLPRRPGAGDDAQSVVTAAMDLDPIAQKMRRVLGKAWMNVARDVEKKAEHEAARAGTALPQGGLVPASVLRDTLAERGVPLTSKEVRAISLKYHGSGTPASRGIDGAVDVERMTAAMFSGSARPTGGRGNTSPSRNRARTAQGTTRG